MQAVAYSHIEGAAEEYFRQKYARAGLDISVNEIQEMVASVSANPVLLADTSLLEISEELRAAADAHTRCALADLLTLSPLIDGEEILAEHASFLTEAMEEIPARTPVLKRTTNRATIYYLYPELTVTEAHAIEYVGVTDALSVRIAGEPGTHPFAEAHLSVLSTADSLDFGEVARSLGGSVVSGALGKVGALVFDAVFPPSIPTYFEDVYRHVAKIVKASLTDHDIDLINARFNAVLSWERTIYAPKNPRGVDSREERRTLFLDVERQIVSLNDALAILKAERWREPGLTAFMMGSGIFLCLAQEAALMDPKASTPHQSSYITTIQLSATDFADHIESTYEQIKDQRIRAVKLKRSIKNVRIGRKTFMSDAYQWVDPIAETKGPFRALRRKGKKKIVGEPKKEAERDLADYVARLPAILNEDLGDPLGMAKKWRRVPDQPLPAT